MKSVSMARIKKFWLVLAIGLCFTIVFFLGVGFYLYHHPERIKPLIERSLSAVTGSSCTIENLSYSFQPMAVEVKGIHLKPLSPQQTFSMNVRFARADMDIMGPLGHRSLIIKNMQLNGVYLDLSLDRFELPTMAPGKEGLSFAVRMVRGLVGFFIFRDIKFQSGEMRDGRISAAMADQALQVHGIHAKVGVDLPLFLSFALEIKRPSRNIHFRAPRVNIHTDKMFDIFDLKLKGAIQSHGMTLQGPELGIRRMDVESRFSYTHATKKLSVVNLQVGCNGIALRPDLEKIGSLPVSVTAAESIWMETGLTYDMKQGGIAFVPLKLHIVGVSLTEKTKKPLPPMDINLEAEGIFHLPTYRLDIAQIHLAFSDILKMEGTLQAELGRKGAVRVQVREALLCSERSRSFFPSEVRQALKPVRIEGMVRLKGRFAGVKADEKWLWECDLESRLAKNPYAFVDKEVQLKGVVSAVIKAKGRFPAVAVSAEMDWDQNILSAKMLALEQFKTHVSLSGRYPRMDIKDVAVQIPQAKIHIGTRDLLIKDIRVQIPECRIDTEKRSVVLPEVRFDTTDLKNILFTADFQEGQINLTIQGAETALFRAATAHRLLPADWDLTARDSIQIKITGAAAGPWRVKAKLSLEDLVFQNKDGSLMGENISLITGIEGDIDLKRSKINFTAALEAKEGEALYDRFYLNLKKNPVITAYNGSCNIRKRLLKLSSLKFDLQGILPIEIHGYFSQDPSKGDTDFTVTIPQVPLKPIFHHLLQEPYKTEKPFLENLETGGTVSAEFNMKGCQNAWEVSGRLGWHGGHLLLRERDISLKGIDFDLPVWYRSRSVKTPVETLEGTLEVQSVMLPLLPEQPLSIHLNTGPNRISVKSPTVIRVPGGDLRLGPVQVNHPFGPDLSVHTFLVFDRIKLQPFLSRIWTRPLEGTLTGMLDPLRYEKNAVTSQGEIMAEAFGGKVLISDLYIPGIFTSAPVLKLNAQWNDLLLSEMTTGTSFGKIEGVLNGHIRDVEIAYGQPQRFDLLLETLKIKGVPQKISVKAVENIAQIGGGQSPFMGLAGAFASFFKKFPYEKIGIRANLENDVFTINGTISEGGTEYLVKRGSFSGVNVINQNPDNRVSFKDMVKRIQRITHKGGPVVR
jgi:hypothetical protein